MREQFKIKWCQARKRYVIYDGKNIPFATARFLNTLKKSYPEATVVPEPEPEPADFLSILLDR